MPVDGEQVLFCRDRLSAGEAHGSSAPGRSPVSALFPSPRPMHTVHGKAHGPAGLEARHGPGPNAIFDDKLPGALNLISCDIYLDERRRPFPPLPPPLSFSHCSSVCSHVLSAYPRVPGPGLDPRPCSSHRRLLSRGIILVERQSPLHPMQTGHFPTWYVRPTHPLRFSYSLQTPVRRRAAPRSRAGSHLGLARRRSRSASRGHSALAVPRRARPVPRARTATAKGRPSHSCARRATTHPPRARASSASSARRARSSTLRVRRRAARGEHSSSVVPPFVPR